MKLLAAVLTVPFTFASVQIAAQTTCSRVGSTTQCTSPASSSTFTQIGQTGYINRTDGSSATVNRIGNTTYINESSPGRSATVNQIGSTAYINRQDGATTVNRVGNTTYFNSPSGKTTSCRQYGSQVFCD